MDDCVIRSGPSRKRAYVRFINRTERLIDILWINHAGVHEIYATIAPNNSLDVNTYASHAWISCDSSSEKRLLINGDKVYFPSRHKNSSNNMNTKELKEVIISLPVFTLLELCADVIKGALRNIDAIDSLKIPDSLKQLLHSNFIHYTV